MRKGAIKLVFVVSKICAKAHVFLTDIVVVTQHVLRGLTQLVLRRNLGEFALGWQCQNLIRTALIGGALFVGDAERRAKPLPTKARGTLFVYRAGLSQRSFSGAWTTSRINLVKFGIENQLTHIFRARTVLVDDTFIRNGWHTNIAGPHQVRQRELSTTKIRVGHRTITVGGTRMGAKSWHHSTGNTLAPTRLTLLIFRAHLSQTQAALLRQTNGVEHTVDHHKPTRLAPRIAIRWRRTEPQGLASIEVIGIVGDGNRDRLAERQNMAIARVFARFDTGSRLLITKTSRTI